MMKFCGLIQNYLNEKLIINLASNNLQKGFAFRIKQKLKFYKEQRNKYKQKKQKLNVILHCKQ